MAVTGSNSTQGKASGKKEIILIERRFFLFSQSYALVLEQLCKWICHVFITLSAILKASGSCLKRSESLQFHKAQEASFIKQV